jgi:hypothetical protein
VSYPRPHTMSHSATLPIFSSANVPCLFPSLSLDSTQTELHCHPSLFCPPYRRGLEPENTPPRGVDGRSPASSRVRHAQRTRRKCSPIIAPSSESTGLTCNFSRGVTFHQPVSGSMKSPA